MKSLLIDIVDRLEKQHLLLLSLTDRLDTLEASFDLHDPHASEERQERLNAAFRNSAGARQAAESLHEDIRQAIYQFQD